MIFSPPYIYVGLFQKQYEIEQATELGRIKLHSEDIFNPVFPSAAKRWFREQTKDMPHNVENCLRADCVTCSYYLEDLMKGSN